MAKVVYSAIVSLDGYIEDAAGSFAFAEPDEELHQAANDEARAASAFLFGRRMYETMEPAWTAAARRDDLPAVEADFARIYLARPRYVFSDTLERVPDGVTLVRRADAVDVVAELKAGTEGELGLGGADLAASVIDLVDEVRLTMVPVAVGGGKPCLPRDRRVDLRLLDHRAFPSGAVSLRYATAQAASA